MLNAPRVLKSLAKCGGARTSRGEGGLVWTINLNRGLRHDRKSTTAIRRPARRLFEATPGNTLGLVDSASTPRTGLPPPARRKAAPKPLSKRGRVAENDGVVKNKDFNLIRKILRRDQTTFAEAHHASGSASARTREKKSMERLQSGRAVGWDMLAPYLEMSPRTTSRPFRARTHVGHPAADWRAGDEGNSKAFDVQGVCPDLRLYDMRVLDENGESDEFSILAALQFIQYLNANSEHPMLHGVNLSLSIRHKVKNFACGCTPVCEETERLVKAGIASSPPPATRLPRRRDGGGVLPGIPQLSSTAPGNGSVSPSARTHRQPHTYGESDTSPARPTARGYEARPRRPGERITSTVPEAA